MYSQKVNISILCMLCRKMINTCFFSIIYLIDVNRPVRFETRSPVFEGAQPISAEDLSDKLKPINLVVDDKDLFPKGIKSGSYTIFSGWKRTFWAILKIGRMLIKEKVLIKKRRR